MKFEIIEVNKYNGDFIVAEVEGKDVVDSLINYFDGDDCDDVRGFVECNLENIGGGNWKIFEEEFCYLVRNK